MAVLTIVQKLEEKSRLSEIGGAAYITGLFNKTPNALNADGYARIVQRMALRRKLIEAAGQIARNDGIGSRNPGYHGLAPTNFG